MFEPLPCPFCGESDLAIVDASIDLEHDSKTISCQNCDAIGPPAPSERSAIILWNKRSNIEEFADDL